jgi:hypothetical protein
LRPGNDPDEPAPGVIDDEACTVGIGLLTRTEAAKEPRPVMRSLEYEVVAHGRESLKHPKCRYKRMVHISRLYMR